MAWKPRRLRKQDIEARVAHLQRNLPHVVREVFGAEAGHAEKASQTKHSVKPKKSKFAVLLWEPRSEGGNT